METDSYSANQRRAINLVWTACGDYQFEPQFLALKADGTPDFYMNCVIGLVRKWLGDEMPRRLFALWADDTRRSAFDDLAWLALENAVYEKELPVRPVLAELRRVHAEGLLQRRAQRFKHLLASRAVLQPLAHDRLHLPVIVLLVRSLDERTERLCALLLILRRGTRG